MNKKLQGIKYLACDYLAAVISWTFFFIFRKVHIESQVFGIKIPVTFDQNFFLSLIFIPLFWVFLYYIAGHYKEVYKKSRLNELGQTFILILIGVIFIFFILILDDTIKTYKNYYSSFFVLFWLHFLCTYIPRLILSTQTIRKIQKGKIGFNTIIIGGSQKAFDVYEEIVNQRILTGNKIIGFVGVKNGKNTKLEKKIPYLGSIEKINLIINEYKIEEIIIAVEPDEHDKINDIIRTLGYMNVTIKAIPDMYDILTGKVKITTIFGAPLIRITDEPMPQWQQSVKQFLDIFISLAALIILLPFGIIIMIMIKMSSKGPVIYSHERVGKFGKTFKILKFRTMYTDAEKNGPRLSKKNDKRITGIGRFLRKTRLDEIPNFVNVLKGDMSLVGPRPERKFFIDQIIEKAPHYYQLHRVKPGITSLGQVKFGYAENVDEMIQRLRYDIIYINNMSLFIDFQILIYTVLTILRGEGK